MDQIGKCVSILVAMSVLAFVVGTASAADIVHLTYTHHGDKYHQYLREKAEEFQALHPETKIDIIIGKHEKFDVMLAAGTPPDVVDLPDYAHLALEGMFVNVLPLLERDGLLDEYSPQIINLMQAPDGGVYAMPFELGMIPTMYNRDLFNQRGLPTPAQLGDEWTWQTVIEAGKKLTVEQDGDGEPEQFGIDRPWAMWRNAVHQAGGRFYDRRIQPTESLWNTEEVLAGIEYVESVYRNGITPHFHVADQTQFYFWTGKTAIDLVDGPGVIGPYLSKASFDWDFYLQPKGPESRASAVGAAGPHILSSTQDLDATWQWVKFYAAEKENIEDWVRMTARIPALVSVQPTYPEVVGITDKDYTYIFQQSVQPNPYSYTLPAELNPRKVNFNPVWSGEVAPKAFLENLHEKFTAAIQELYGDT